MEHNPDHEKDLILTVSIPPNKTKKEAAIDVSKKMALIAYISAAITFLVKRTVYGKIKDIQPDGLPVTVPDTFAFPAWGAIATGAALAMKKNAAGEEKKLTRRNFFFVSAGAAGAMVGSVLADTMPQADHGRSGNAGGASADCK